MSSKTKGDRNNSELDGASPGKIFVGGLPKDTSIAIFLKHFGKYGEIIDSVIMKDRHTQQPRGFGFITYADPSVVDKVMEDTHIINGKQVEIKRTIPKGSVQSKDFKTKKIFVGGVPSNIAEDDFKGFFSKFGKVVDHEIIRDHTTKRSRGFGFIIFDSEKVVDDLVSKGNMIDLAGNKVEIKKAEPRKASNPPPRHYASESRGRSYGDSGFGSSFGDFGGSFGSSSYGVPGGLGSRFGSYGGYSGSSDEFGSGYGGFGSNLGGFRGESSLGYGSRLSSYGGGYGAGYGSSGGYGAGYGSSGGLGGYGRDEGFGGYGGGGYDSTPGAGYGSGGGLYGGRGGYGAGAGPAGRYHPYAR